MVIRQRAKVNRVERKGRGEYFTGVRGELKYTILSVVNGGFVQQ
jgi:hypothetical protein